MNIVLIIYGPSLLSIVLLALGIFLARSKNAHRAWGVLAGAVILLQGFLLIGALLFFGMTSVGSLVATLTRSPGLCVGFALWLVCCVARTIYFFQGRKRFDSPTKK